MNQNLTKELLYDLQTLMSKTFNDKDYHQVCRCLLDYLGCAFAGTYILKNKLHKIIEISGTSSEGSFPVGMKMNLAPETAALINGISSHVAEMDDGVRFGMIHPGAPIFSALLPVAYKFNVSGEDLIRGVLVGYDAAIRLAMAIQPSHYNLGYHPTATCGSIGAAMGVAAMLSFTINEMEIALAAASISAAGSLKVIEDSSELKPYNVGHAAALAVQAATIGKAGFNPPNDSLNGNTGFLKMNSEIINSKVLLEPSPNNYWIHSTYIKPYAACRHAHPSIEGVLEILKKQLFKPSEITKISITTYGGLLGRHDNQAVSNFASAKMSIPFSIAIAINSGSVGINDFNQNNIDSVENKLLAKKVFIFEDKKYSDRVPNQRPAMVEIFLNNGKSYKKEVIYPKGEPENPLNDEDLKDKYRELSRYSGLAINQYEKVLNKVWGIRHGLDGLFSELIRCNLISIK